MINDNCYLPYHPEVRKLGISQQGSGPSAIRFGESLQANSIGTGAADDKKEVHGFQASRIDGSSRSEYSGVKHEVSQTISEPSTL